MNVSIFLHATAAATSRESTGESINIMTPNVALDAGKKNKIKKSTLTVDEERTTIWRCYWKQPAD